MRARILLAWLIASLVAAPLAAQQTPQPPEGPWWFQVFVFIVSLPYTLFLVFAEGDRWRLLPAPLLGLSICQWSFREWRRQGYWTPRIVHIMAILALAVIILINVDWVLAGGEMWTQRYVVIAVFGLFPYVAYLLFLGPRYLGRKRAPKALQSLTEGSRPATHQGGEVLQPATRSARGARRLYAVLGAAMAVILAFSYTIASGAAALEDQYEGLANPESLVPLASGVLRGDPAAELTIVEFGDYQCPGCGHFATHDEGPILEAFVETGRANFLYYDLPLTSLHPNTFLASRAAHCAGDQEAYWTYHDELYRQQEAWSPLADPSDAFAEYAGTIGLDVAQFQGCLASDRHADRVRANDELASALAIRSTPTIIVMTADGAIARRSPQRAFQAVSATFERVAAAAAAR